MDGNFSADHMQMKNSKDDVSLTDGNGYMVQEAPYHQHLLESKEVPGVSILFKLNVLK